MAASVAYAPCEALHGTLTRQMAGALPASDRLLSGRGTVSGMAGRGIDAENVAAAPPHS